MGYWLWKVDATFYLGCHQLAAIEEDVVIAFTPMAGEDSQRLVVVLNRAHKVCQTWLDQEGSHFLQLARQGQYNNSLKMLLDPEVWRGISITSYTSWAHEIWHVLTLRAIRRCVVDFTKINYINYK